MLEIKSFLQPEDEVHHLLIFAILIHCDFNLVEQDITLTSERLRPIKKLGHHRLESTIDNLDKMTWCLVCLKLMFSDCHNEQISQVIEQSLSCQ